MTVSQILQSKPINDVATISSTKSMADAAGIMSSMRIGALVVSEDGKSVDGILSERDIVREIGKRGPGCLSDSISECMTKDIITCKISDAADAVLAKMTKGRFRHLPVVEDGAMIGLISIGDVVKARLSEISMENEAMESMIKGF